MFNITHFNLIVFIKSIIIYFIISLGLRLIVIILLNVIVRVMIGTSFCVQKWVKKFIINFLNKYSNNIYDMLISLLSAIYTNLDFFINYLISFEHYLRMYNFQKIIIKSFSPNIFNLIIILFVYNLIDNNLLQSALLIKSDFYSLIIYVKDMFNQLNLNYKKIFYILLAFPIIKNTYCYIIYKLYSDSGVQLLNINLAIEIKGNINDNIKTIKLYKDELINIFLKDLTEDLPYRLNNGKLVAYKVKIPYYTQSEDKVSISSLMNRNNDVSKMIKQKKYNTKINSVNKFTRLINDKFDEYFNNLFSRYNAFYFLERRLILKDKENREYLDCKSYFSENQNRIYKYRFTNIRVIRKESLNQLDNYERRVSTIMKEYSEDLEQYLFEILIEKNRLEKLLREVKKYISIQGYFNHISLILKHTLIDYFKFFIKLAV